MNTMHLIGSEDVARAGNSMRQAADEMQRAANQFEESVQRMQRAMDDRASRMEAIAEKMGK